MLGEDERIGGREWLYTLRGRANDMEEEDEEAWPTRHRTKRAD